MEGFAGEQQVDARGEPILYEATCSTEEYSRYLQKREFCAILEIYFLICLALILIVILPLLLLPLVLCLCRQRTKSVAEKRLKKWRLYVTNKNIYYSYFLTGYNNWVRGTITYGVPLASIGSIQIKETGCLCCYTCCTDNLPVVEVVMKRGQYARPVDRPHIQPAGTSEVDLSRSVLLITGVANPESFINIVQGQMMKLSYNY